MRWRTVISSHWAQRIWRWTLLLILQRLRDHLIELIRCATWGIALRRCLPCSANSCRDSRCPGHVTSWTSFYHNSPQSGPLGGCYSDIMDLPPHSCFLTWEWISVLAKGYHRFFFTSHDHIHHVRIFWHSLPLLLFSDSQTVYPVDVDQFQVHRLNQQHIQLGLRKGMAVLVYYRVQRGLHVNEVFQAVLIAHESAVTRGKNTENKLWKRVVPSETEFGWLPPNIAWAFCSDALRRRRDCLAFYEAHMGLQGRAFQANIFIVDMVFLVTQEVLKSLLFSPTWPQKGCV